MAELTSASNEKKLFTTFIKPIAVGASAYFISQLLFFSGDNVMLPLLGNTVSLPVFMALAEAGISYITEPISLWVLPYITNDADKISLTVKPLIHGGLSYALMNTLYPSLVAKNGIAGDYVNSIASQYF